MLFAQYGAEPFYERLKSQAVERRSFDMWKDQSRSEECRLLLIVPEDLVDAAFEVVECVRV